jgi:hypothetical protein
MIPKSLSAAPIGDGQRFSEKIMRRAFKPHRRGGIDSRIRTTYCRLVSASAFQSGFSRIFRTLTFTECLCVPPRPRVFGSNIGSNSPPGRQPHEWSKPRQPKLCTKNTTRFDMPTQLPPRPLKFLSAIILLAGAHLLGQFCALVSIHTVGVVRARRPKQSNSVSTQS